MKLIIAFPVYICAIFVFVQSTGAVKLPKGFLKCKQNDADFQKCVTKGANLAIPELVKGQPRFAIPSIDPLKITNLYIDQGHGSVKIKLNFTNLEIYGLNSAVCHDVSVDFEKNLLKLKLDLRGPMKLLGHYQVNGQVLILPISGDGPCNLTLHDFKADTVSHFEPVEKHGETHWQMKHLDFDFGISKLYVQLDNLFNGDKTLGPQMNIFLNENWSEIFNELRPAFRTALATVLTDIAKRFFDKVPLDAVFPKH